MQELTINEVAEISGGSLKTLSRLKIAFDAGYAIGQGINWLLENSYGGRGEFPPVPRAGHE